MASDAGRSSEYGAGGVKRTIKRKGEMQATLEDFQKKVEFQEEQITLNGIRKYKKRFKRLESEMKAEGEKRKELEKKMDKKSMKLEKKSEHLMEWRRRCEDEEDGMRFAGSMKSNSSQSSGWSDERRMLVDDTRKILKSTVRKVEPDNRAKRRKNIVIRGVENLNERNLKESMERFLFEMLGVDVKVEDAWKNGKVVIVKMATENQKREVLMNKSKLKETRIFIAQDLSYDDRQRQLKIQGWVKKRKEMVGGEELKVGIGRVYVHDRWIPWEVIKEEEKIKKEKKRAIFSQTETGKGTE